MAHHHECECCSHEHHHEHHHEEESPKQKLLLIAVTVVLLLAAVFVEHHFNLSTWQLLLVYLVPYLVIGHDTLKEAAEGVAHGDAFNEHPPVVHHGDYKVFLPELRLPQDDRLRLVRLRCHVRP